MDTRITGLINEGDTRELREWIEKLTSASADSEPEIVDLRNNIQDLSQSVYALQKQLDRIERLLTKGAE